MFHSSERAKVVSGESKDCVLIPLPQALHYNLCLKCRVSPMLIKRRSGAPALCAVEMVSSAKRVYSRWVLISCENVALSALTLKEDALLTNLSYR